MFYYHFCDHESTGTDFLGTRGKTMVVNLPGIYILFTGIYHCCGAGAASFFLLEPEPLKNVQ
jgi:hypothetical protein